MDLIVVMTPEGEIRYLSPALKRLLDLRDEPSSADLAALLHPEDLSSLRRLIGEDTAGPWPRTARVRIGPGPQWRELDLEAEDRRGDPTFGGFVVTARDVTSEMAAAYEREAVDPLTGLVNRQVFVRRLDGVLAGGDGRRVAVLLVDLDRFRTINESLGHGVGDTLLVSAAQRVSEVESDRVFVARLGGDEFGVACVQDGPASVPDEVAATLLRAFRRPFVLGGLDVALHCSVGIAVGRTGDGVTGEELLQQADSALYAAKTEGRDQASTYTPLMGVAVRERVTLRNALPKAFERAEFELWYQPIMSLSTGRVTSFEALLRWPSPQHGMVPPDVFVPLAEESMLIVALGRWVLETACAQLARWRREYPAAATLSVAVNVSGRQFGEPAFCDEVTAILEANDLPATALTLEVTESLTLAEATLVVLERLHRAGVRLAIDDFGTGHSSLGRLQRMPVHVLKLDRSLVAPLDAADPRGVAFVRSIGLMATSLGLTTVAEGVETREQLHLLRNADLDAAQGYLLGRPAPAHQLTQVLRTCSLTDRLDGIDPG